jgi:beta-xylosidase
VTNDLYSARNALTHRILGPTSTAAIVLDYSQMKDGDRAGLALLRDSSAWVGIKREAGSVNVVMVNNLTMDKQWKTVNTGTEIASAPISGGKIWFRVSADIRPGAKQTGNFSYSTDGTTFKPIGASFVLNNEWMFFMGYRYGIFNYATQSLGGIVSVSSFTMTSP